jgi:hypothetical protein
MSKIDRILERNPNWPELVQPEYGYLEVAEPNHVSFVSASQPGWDDLFRYPSNNEVSDAIDAMEIGQEIVVVLEVDAPPEDEADWYVEFEVVNLPVPIPVPEE